jgi:hypothetical protein
MKALVIQHSSREEVGASQSSQEGEEQEQSLEGSEALLVDQHQEPVRRKPKTRDDFEDPLAHDEPMAPLSIGELFQMS